MEVGKKFYIIAHAYWHVIGEVVEVVGPKTVVLRNVVYVYSSRKNWTEFFKKGIGTGDTYDIWPDGTTVTAIIHIPWEHEIPTVKK